MPRPMIEFSAAGAAVEMAADALREAEAEAVTARAPWQEALARRTRIEAEIAALDELLAAMADKSGAPVLDAVAVQVGYEAALGAALGDDLTAPVKTGVAVHWHELPPYTYDLALPDDAQPLANFVTAPAVLKRRLSQVGVVANAESAARWQSALAPGQRLVTRDGGCWRWDGLRRAPGTPSAAAQRLKQRNRIADLKQEKSKSDGEVAAFAERFGAAQRAFDAAGAAERAGREAMRQALAVLADAQKTDAEYRESEATLAARRTALQENEAQLAIRLDETTTREREARAAIATIPATGAPSGRDRSAAVVAVDPAGYRSRGTRDP